MESNKEEKTPGRPRVARYDMGRMKRALEQIIACCNSTNNGDEETMDLCIKSIKREAEKGLDTTPEPKKKVIIHHVKNLKL